MVYDFAPSTAITSTQFPANAVLTRTEGAESCALDPDYPHPRTPAPAQTAPGWTPAGVGRRG